MTLALDPARSTVTIHTRAVGLLAVLGHDIVLCATGMTGTADEASRRGELVCPVEELHVQSSIRKSAFGKQGLSDAERADIERRVKTEVFGGRGEIRVSVDGAIRPRRFTVEARTGTGIFQGQAAIENQSGGMRAHGRVTLSLKALGIKEVKGPLGVLKVQDAVEVLFDAFFVRPPTAHAHR
jgi:hypothetical protein